MSVKPSDSESSLSSKTGDARSHSYSSSLGGSVSSTTSASASSSSLHSQTGSIVPPSETGSLLSLSEVSLLSMTGALSSISDISLKSETGILSSPSNVSLKSETGLNAKTGVQSSISDISLKSETGSNVTGIRTADGRPYASTDIHEKMGIPSPSVSFISCVSQMPLNCHTSSIRSPKSPDTRKDIHPSSQTPVREKPQDFSHRSIPSSKDSPLYQPSGRYNSSGKFIPGDATLDNIPDIPTEKSDQTGSPPLRTATESVSSTSLCLTSSVVPDKIYGDPEDEIGAKSDKQFVGNLALKKNKKKEAGFEFEPSESKDRSMPATSRKLKATNVFGGADRKYVPPVRIAKPPTPAICARFPPLPDDSRAQLTTVNDVSRAVRSTVTDRDLAPSLPLSVTKKSDRVVPPFDPSVPTNVSLLRTETSLLSSSPHCPTPTSSPAVKSPIPAKKDKKKGVEKVERPLLSPLAPSPLPPKKRGDNRRKTEHTTTPKERVVYRETPVSPTLGTPKRQFRKKKGDKEDQSKKERERTKKSDRKKSNARATRDASDQTSAPTYQNMVYSSYVTNGLNVACYKYDEQEVQRKKPVS